ncbi:MAG TPA: phenylalanine--tRNA ligase beta subunit-related protein [Stellaceae bacterium]|nr:phenylalanine--tRNA ligase beta subunit-related protein [Stellaceae bacterium]
MIELSIADVLPQFPEFRVAVGLLTSLAPAEAPAPGIRALVHYVERDVQASLAERDLDKVPEINRWRAAFRAVERDAQAALAELEKLPEDDPRRALYRATNAKKIVYRSSCEALLRKLKGGELLPRALPLIDLCNTISVRFRVAVSVNDLAALKQPLLFRYSGEGERFLDASQEPPVEDLAPPREVVYADAEKLLSRRWNWRQDGRSLVKPDSREAVVAIETLEPDGETRLQGAIGLFRHHAEGGLGAKTQWAIASKALPSVTLG